MLFWNSVQSWLLKFLTLIRKDTQVSNSWHRTFKRTPNWFSRYRKFHTHFLTIYHFLKIKLNLPTFFQEVCSQIWATLYDYPCLKSCDGIIKYVKECVRVAWGLVNQVNWRHLTYPVYILHFLKKPWISAFFTNLNSEILIW